MYADLTVKKFVKFEKRKQIFFFPFGFIAQTFYV